MSEYSIYTITDEDRQFSQSCTVVHCADVVEAIEAAAQWVDINRCVIDVRDKTSKYDTSPNCRALSDIAKRYIAAGGLKQSAPCVADRIAEGAHAKAWMALAVSKTGDPNLVIW